MFDRGEIPNFDHAVPIWKWMESIRECETPIASFYFPDTLAGPDILFALEPKESASIGSSFGGRILCILQVSLGLSVEINGLLTFLRLKS